MDLVGHPAWCEGSMICNFVFRKVSRRRSSRHRESRVSLLQTEDSSESAIGSHKPSTTSGHGVLDRNGISIGSGKGTPPFEGLVTKSMKRMRSRMSDIIIRVR